MVGWSSWTRFQQQLWRAQAFAQGGQVWYYKRWYANHRTWRTCISKLERANYVLYLFVGYFSGGPDGYICIYIWVELRISRWHKRIPVWNVPQVLVLPTFARRMKRRQSEHGSGEVPENTSLSGWAQDHLLCFTHLSSSSIIFIYTNFFRPCPSPLHLKVPFFPSPTYKSCLLLAAKNGPLPWGQSKDRTTCILLGLVKYRRFEFSICVPEGYLVASKRQWENRITTALLSTDRDLERMR